MTTLPRVTAEEFIEAWQSSSTLAEVSEKIGRYKPDCYARASYYRRKGVPLKCFPKARSHNWQALIELAKNVEEKSA